MSGSDTRRDEVKKRLREGMAALLETTSFRDLRVESVAEAAGLSRSAFYFYYRDKRDLLMDAAAGMSEELFRQADRWWHGDGSPDALVREALGGVAQNWVDNEVLLRTVTEVSTYDDEMRRFWRGMVTRFVTATADHIEREQADAKIDASLDAERTAEQMIWGAERTLYIFISTGERDSDDVVASIADFWLRALYGSDERALAIRSGS
jgi:TetR/AcrR family transcriptional regulator, ethionamide resistance regulator